MNTLFTRLSIAFLLVLLSLGLVSVWIFHHNVNNSHLEFIQKENSHIAKYMAEQAELAENGYLNSDALDELATHILRINPRIEVYLLDKGGAILPGGSFLTEQALNKIDLVPIKKFIGKDAVYPILGTDPRDINAKRVFSVHPLYTDNSIESAPDTKQQALGYLYVILANSNRTNLLEALYSSKSFRNSMLALLVK